MSIVDFGAAQTGLSSDFGLPGPEGIDFSVLKSRGFGPNAGLYAALPAGTGALKTYSLVWDLYLEEMDSGFTSLLQTNLANGNDGDLFIRADYGLGVNGSYAGTVPSNSWTRIAITVQDQGNGQSSLSKYIDGVLVGTQMVETARYTLQPDGVLLLADDDGETAPSYLA
ncbi:MAG: LamG domain-containing protein, partial [Mangrovicoccus sp.]|nr:LamG domain-containing protein [Mangrovicoccus sp.]